MLKYACLLVNKLAPFRHPDRAEATAVMAPVEVLSQHSADRSRGQSIVVKQNSDGSFSAVDDVDILANHDVATSDEETSSDEDATRELQVG